MEPREILEYFKGRREAMIELIREVVDIESPSYDAVQSRKVADWIENAARETGVDVAVERISVDDGDHIVIRAFPSSKKPVLLLGHTDTVHPVGTAEKNPTRIEGDKFYGCGVFDMKSGIVLMIEALRFFGANGVQPSRPINILLSSDEEIGSRTGRELVEREAKTCEYCLVLEPSADGKAKTGRKGTGMYTLTAHGIPAHAGLEPEKGANAITELSRQVEPIHALADLSVGTTVSICTIRGGTTTNVIPEHAEFTVDVRFTSMAEAERVDAAIRSLQPSDRRVSVEVTGGINRPPLERMDAVVALYEKARDLAVGFDYDLGETQVGGASDGNFVGALGVPVLDGLGVAGNGAHTLNEYILASDLATRATLIAMLIRDQS